jgi:hypothetical protein
MARNVLLFALIMVFTEVLDGAWNGSVLWPRTAIELERNLRATQALALIVLAGLSAHSQIPMARNVKGIFSGYATSGKQAVVTALSASKSGASSADPVSDRRRKNPTAQ